MGNELLPSGESLLYNNGGEKEFVSVVFKDETFWLSQSGMAELFECSTDNISLHLKNIYKEEELDLEATTEKISVVRKEGKREVRRTNVIKLRGYTEKYYLKLFALYTHIGNSQNFSSMNFSLKSLT